jgi:transcriptional regulator with XRE-family HTH domain
VIKEGINWREVGNRMRQIRKECRLSQRELGLQLGVSQNMISLYEKGRSRATVDFYVQLARLGNKTLEWLIGGRRDPSLETLHEMRELHERMHDQLTVVRDLLEGETERSLERTLTSTDDPQRTRQILLADEKGPPNLREVLNDGAFWQFLQLTGREAWAVRILAAAFPAMGAEKLRAVLMDLR